MKKPLPILQEVADADEIGGASGARLFQFLAYGKGNSKKFPYNVVNEKIASELARVVGLPVPEVLLVEHRGEWLFLSRSVAQTKDGETKPLGTAQNVADAVNRSPGIMEEAVCFDLFVCNNDRNGGNFLCDAYGQLWLIDYGNSLFYRPRQDPLVEMGIARLQAVDKSLNARFDKPYALFPTCKNWEAMQRGFGKIAAIPDYFIENTVDRLPTGLISEKEKEFVTEFLCKRKKNMETIVRGHAHLFVNLVVPN